MRQRTVVPPADSDQWRYHLNLDLNRLYSLGHVPRVCFPDSVDDGMVRSTSTYSSDEVGGRG